MVADIAGKRIFYHELVWFIHNGKIPSGKLVNHKDFDTSNNSIENLELVEENDERGDLHLDTNKIFHENTFDHDFIRENLSGTL
jgi:hypothetical protein